MSRNITITFNEAIDLVKLLLDSKDEETKNHANIIVACIIRDTNINQIKGFIMDYFGGGKAWKDCGYKGRFHELFGTAILGDI